MHRRHVILGAASALMLLPFTQKTAFSVERDNSALLKRYIELKNAHDANHCEEIYADNYIEHSGRTPSGIASLIKNWKTQFEGYSRYPTKA